MYKGQLLIGGFLFAAVLAMGQPAPSPFSGVGIGRLNNDAFIQQQASGAVGIGMGSYWNINNINPAMLMYTRGTIFGGLTVFQAGTTYDNKIIRNQTNSERSSGAGLSYLSLGFPVIQNRWFSTIGLSPYSSMNYNQNYMEPYPGSPYDAEVSEVGSGGINQLYWSNGVTVHKNLSVGIKTQFLFSSIIRETITEVSTDEIPVRFASALYERTNYTGMLVRTGLVYQDSIPGKGNDPLKVTVGLTYDIGKDVKAREFQTIQRRLITGTVWEADTVRNNQEGTLYVPSSLGLGISFSKFFKWTVGADIRLKNYTGMELFGERLNTSKGFFAGLGAEITPDAFSVEDYLKRVTYRAGVNYERSPYLINGMEVNEFGINFGLSLPIVPSTSTGSVVNKGFSSVDLGFQYGFLGTVEANTIREEYFKVHFGVTFNDRWFVKRRFN